jgi:methionyl-tRNA formyltransferase
VPTLEALIEAGHEVACVYSQPPKPAGRGHKLQNSPVHEAGLKHGIEVRTPTTLKAADAQSSFFSLHLDAVVVVAYGLILPRAILEAPRLGCFNLHASLLPRWRGAAPIHRAIMAGDMEAGVMVMKMDEGLDTGPILSEWHTLVDDATTTATLQHTLAVNGAALVVQTLNSLALGQSLERPQASEGVTYAKKILVEEARIDWARPARDVLRHIHALNPSPGAWTMFGENRLKILRVRLANEAREQPGSIVAAPLVVACRDGALEIIELQRAGRSAQSAAEFVRGFPIPLGTQLT